MWEISKEFRFEAAHNLWHLPEGHKCRRMHGHSYRVVVIVRGDLDDQSFVLDYAEISKAVAPYIEKLDHRFLNEMFTEPTTAEVLAKYFYDQLAPALRRGEQCWLHQIELYETAKTCVRYPV